MKPANVFDTYTDAAEHLRREGPDKLEIMVWTNKQKEKKYSVIRKRSKARKRKIA